MATDAPSRATRSDRATLRRLAKALRIFTHYQSAKDGKVEASDESLLHLISGLGHPIEDPSQAQGILEELEKARAERRLEPITVVWTGAKAVARLRIPEKKGATGSAEWTIRTEDGRTLTGRHKVADLPTTTRRPSGTPAGSPPATYALIPLPGSSARTPAEEQFGEGYHRLTVTHAGDSFESLIISAPKISYQVPAADGVNHNGHSLGLFCPTYSIRSARNHGIGDLTDLRDLASWGADHGADLISTLPLLASFLRGDVFNPGPYAPVTRLFWNELLLDPERAPGFGSCEAARSLLATPEYRKRSASLRRAKLIDYRAVAAHKRELLETLSESFFASGGDKSPEYKAFLDETPDVREYARFRAVGEARDEPWQQWPQRLKNGKLRKGDFRPEDERYHLYAQFAMHEQLAAFSTEMAERAGKLYLDLPVGTHASGYDIWKSQDLFITGAAVGAPPDPVFTSGQNWGFPPMHPERAREEGYAYFIASLRNHLRHAHFLRLDHVMCFYRLFMIPADMEAKDGAYVGYEAEEMFAILCIESHRARCRLIGENLGTVPEAINSAMEKHRIGALYIGQFSIDASKKGKPGTLRSVPANRAASLNTHDLPPFALHLSGDDIDERLRLGVFAEELAPAERRDRAASSDAVRRFLTGHGYCSADASPTDLAIGFNRYLAESDAELALVNIEDLWGETRPQNVPGTSEQYPNWRQKLARTMSEITGDEKLSGAIENLARLREGETNKPERRSSRPQKPAKRAAAASKR